MYYEDYDYDPRMDYDYEDYRETGCGEGYSCYNCPNLGCPANERN